MADMNWDYIAGFIDGEGSFTIASQDYYFHPRLSISQNTSDVLEEIQCFFIAHSIKSSLYQENHKPRRNIWYNLRTQDRKSLIKLWEFLDGKLFVKDKQLSVIYELLQIKSGDKTRTDLPQRVISIEESLRCREEIMRLNQSGKVG